jgi:hypothetical protein
VRTVHDKVGVKTFYLRRVPHALSINRKSERASSSKLLLTVLMEQTADGSQRIITGNESWFFFCYPRDLTWVVSRNALPRRTKQKVGWRGALFQSFGRPTHSTVFMMYSK